MRQEVGKVTDVFIGHSKGARVSKGKYIHKQYGNSDIRWSHDGLSLPLGKWSGPSVSGPREPRSV